MTELSSLIAGFALQEPEERRRLVGEILSQDPGEPGTIELLMRALSDEDWRVRKEGVVVALGLSPDQALIQRLIDALGPGDNVGLRNAASEALGGFGDALVDALGPALGSLDADGRKLAVEALGRCQRPGALELLERALGDPDPNVRAAAAEAVVGIGGAGVPGAAQVLERCLTVPEPLVALAALEGLNALGHALSWDLAERCLNRPPLRRAALLAAGKTGDPRAVPALLEALDSARAIGMGEIVLGLRDLARSPRALSELMQSASHLSSSARGRLVAAVADESVEDEVKRAALVVMGALRLEEASASALSALGDDQLLAEAHEVFLLLGSRGLDTLVEGSQHSNAQVRASAIGLLSRICADRDAPIAERVARNGLTDPSSQVRREALAALSRIGDADSLGEVARSLAPDAPVATLSAGEAALRRLSLRYPEAARDLALHAGHAEPAAYPACVVISALGGARGSVKADLAFLSDALSNPSARVRRSAVEALASLAGEDTAETVAFALTDEERSVREAAVAALGRMRSESGDASGLPYLVAMVERFSDPELIAAAARAMGETDDPSAAAALAPLVGSGHALVAISAIEALSRRGDPRHARAFQSALSHPQPEVVKAALLALSELDQPGLSSLLAECLEHPVWDVRRLAADLLGRVGGAEVERLLRARLEREDSAAVQEAIARALGRRQDSLLPRAPGKA